VNNLGFEDDDRRNFPCDDIMYGPCPLLAAIYADNKLDEAWQWGENSDYEASLTFWRKQVSFSLAAGALLFWQCQIAYQPERES
jgi:hypothetical protein